MLPYISTNNISELNDLIYAGAKLVCEKIGVPSKSTKKQSKPGWEVQLDTQIKNLRKQAKMVRQKDPGICWKRMEKTTREKITVKLEEINQKILAKEGRLKRYRQRIKQYSQNRTFQNNERKFHQQLGGHDTKNLPTTRRQRNRTILDENIATKIWHNVKAEWINNMTRELEGLEEGPKAEINIELIIKTLKKISNWKTPWHNGIHGFWFKKFTSVNDRLALEMNRCLQDAQVPDWMTKGKTTLIQKDPSKGTAPKIIDP